VSYILANVQLYIDSSFFVSCHVCSWQEWRDRKNNDFWIVRDCL